MASRPPATSTPPMSPCRLLPSSDRKYWVLVDGGCCLARGSLLYSSVAAHFFGTVLIKRAALGTLSWVHGVSALPIFPYSI